MHGANAGIFTANMYLAEDRILCFEIVTKRNCRWLLQYVKSSTGETDVPDQMAEFILQRRRWLNGSFFAAVYAIAHFYQIWRSDHSAIRKFALLIEFFYQTINMLFAWFGIVSTTLPSTCHCHTNLHFRVISSWFSTFSRHISVRKTSSAPPVKCLVWFSSGFTSQHW